MAKLASAVAKTGATIVLLPADYMTWNENNASVMSYMTSRSSGENAKKHLWILGQVSGKMRAQLLLRDWYVHTEAGRLLRSGEG